MPSVEFMPDVILPINEPNEARKIGKHSHQVLGRLKAGVTIAQAQSEITQTALQLEQQYPNSNVGHGAQIIAFHGT